MVEEDEGLQPHMVEDLSLKKKKQTSTEQLEQDKAESPTKEDQMEDEEANLLQDSVPSAPPIKRQSRGCCMRMMCLICCCDTSDIGSAANLNTLNEKEIELYQKQLRKEMDRRNNIKTRQLDSDTAKPGADVIPMPQVGSQGSK